MAQRRLRRAGGLIVTALLGAMLASSALTAPNEDRFGSNSHPVRGSTECDEENERTVTAIDARLGAHEHVSEARFRREQPTVQWLNCAKCTEGEMVCWHPGGGEGRPVIAQAPDMTRHGPNDRRPFDVGTDASGSDTPIAPSYDPEGGERRYGPPQVVQPDSRPRRKPDPLHGSASVSGPGGTHLPPLSPQDPFIDFPKPPKNFSTGTFVDVACLWRGRMLFPDGWVYVCLGQHQENERIGGVLSPMPGHRTPYASISGVFANNIYYVDTLDGRRFHSGPKPMNLQRVVRTARPARGRRG